MDEGHDDLEDDDAHGDDHDDLGDDDGHGDEDLDEKMADEQDVLDGAWEDLDEVEVEQWVQVWLEKLVE